MLGFATFMLAIARKEEANLQMIFSGFKHFGRAAGLYLLMMLFVFLWMLLLIIPGIIAALSYSLVFFLMSDNPNIGIMEAIKKSKKMMYGYKWKLFCLGLRFLGWLLLPILFLMFAFTGFLPSIVNVLCFLGLLWIAPYMQVSYVKFYEDVKANFVEEN